MSYGEFCPKCRKYYGDAEWHCKCHVPKPTPTEAAEAQGGERRLCPCGYRNDDTTAPHYKAKCPLRPAPSPSVESAEAVTLKPSKDNQEGSLTPSDATDEDKRRFESKIRKNAVTGCWIWLGGKTSRGYGIFGLQGKTVRAHAAAKYLYDGVPLESNSLKDRMHWDHLCERPLCVNPAHLELVPEKENILRGTGKCAENARKTKCHKGHDLSGDNLVPSTNGYRVCRACNRERNAIYEKHRPPRSGQNGDKT